MFGGMEGFGMSLTGCVAVLIGSFAVFTANNDYDWIYPVSGLMVVALFYSFYRFTT